MSNSTETKKTIIKPSTTTSKRWSLIQKDLLKAVDKWQELEKAGIKLSPDDEQLIKIKTILSQLKEKLKQF